MSRVTARRRDSAPSPRLMGIPWLVIALSLVLVTPIAAAATTSDAAALYAQGRFEEAISAWQRQLKEGGGSPAANVDTQLNIAAGYLALGNPSLGLAAAQSAYEAASGLSGTVGQSATARALHALGRAYVATNITTRGIERLNEAIVTAREANRPDLVSRAANDLAAVLSAQGDQSAAKDALILSGNAARESGKAALAAKAFGNLARIQHQLGDRAGAASSLNNGRALFPSIPTSHEKASILINAGRLRAQVAGTEPNALPQWLLAIEDLNQAADIAESIGNDRNLSFAWGYLGELYETTGQHNEALELTRRAVLAAQRAGAAESLYRWQWQTGRLLASAGRRNEAVQAYRRAVDSLERIRKDLTASGAAKGKSYRNVAGKVYLELTDLLLQEAHASGAADQTPLLKQARSTVELLKGAELADYFEDDCVDRFRAQSAGIDTLEKRTAAIYPIILPDRLELLLSTGDVIERFTVPVDSATLTEQIRKMRRHLERRIAHRYRSAAKKLHDWLITPLEARLKALNVETLVFVPDGALRTVPIATLYDGEQFLIERYAIATTPGLTLTDPRPIPRTDIQVLANGLTEGVQGFSPLPAVKGELTSIGALFNGLQLQDRRFNVANVEEALATTPYTVVHIASHGQFGTSVQDTFLLTYDGQLTMDKLGDLMGVAAARRKPVELLTLSACQTAAGDDRAALGLAGVAVKSGARSALATLWFVNDEASSLLVSDFYRHLQDPSISKAQALRNAQLGLLKQRAYRHPAFWGPYLLIGNWL